MMYWNGMNGWGFGMMTLGMLLFFGLLVVGLVAVFRHLDHAPLQHPTVPPGATGPGPTDPEQVLAERLARGEIDADEYRTRLDVLRAGRGTGAGRTEGRPS